MGARTAQYTGSYIVLLDPRHQKAALTALRSGAGIGDAQSAAASDVAGTAEALESGETIVFDEIGVARGRGRAGPAASARAHRGRVAERARDGAGARRLRVRPAVAGVPAGLPRRCRIAGGDRARRDSRRRPGWSRHHRRRRDPLYLGAPIVRALESSFSGAGIRVCVLDTGVDSAHPDLADRIAKTESFIAGELEDGHGHGTHCIGTAFGPKDPQTLPRYGVAYDAEVFAGKVLSDAGSGADRGILAGINWGISKGCRVISMSLGAATQRRGHVLPGVRAVAQRAMRSRAR